MMKSLYSWFKRVFGAPEAPLKYEFTVVSRDIWGDIDLGKRIEGRMVVEGFHHGSEFVLVTVAVDQSKCPHGWDWDDCPVCRH